MSSAGIEKCKQALEVVKQDYTCGVCFKLCIEPVILSKCFHMICAEHFDGLKTCPNCDTSLDGCTTYVDQELATCIHSTIELSRMFASHSNSKAGPKKVEGKFITESKSKNVSLISNSKVNKSVEKRNTKGETMLHIACRLGKVDRITELLQQGANSNTKDNAGWTPLHEVVQNGRLDLVRLLLQHNTLINVPGQSNETALHEAIRYNHLPIIEELVLNGADIHIRNCKGETPYQLASTDMKNFLLQVSENILQTQSVNIGRIAKLYTELDTDDIRVYCVSEYRSVKLKLSNIVKHHSNVHIEGKFTKKVTHLIVDTEDNGMAHSSVDILQGILTSIWVVSTEWITKSTEDKLEPFNKYEIKGIGTKMHQGAKTSRFNKYKQLPGLFDGCHIYLHNFHLMCEISKTLVLTKPILTKLISEGGGVVLRRVPNPESIPEPEKLVPYHAAKGSKLMNCSHYIVFKDKYEPMYNMQHLKALPVAWLIECIERFQLCDP